MGGLESEDCTSLHSAPMPSAPARIQAPGLIAPLGWELSEAARTDLRAGLTNPHPADTTGKAVDNIRALQFRLAAEKKPDRTIGLPLSRCIPAPP